MVAVPAVFLYYWLVYFFSKVSGVYHDYYLGDNICVLLRQQAYTGGTNGLQMFPD